MYPIDDVTNMMVRRNVDEYPEYIKNETGMPEFSRQIETQGISKQQTINATDYTQKQSTVNLTSVMKSKNNGKTKKAGWW